MSGMRNRRNLWASCMIVLACLVYPLTVTAATESRSSEDASVGQDWTFVSFPDFFNFDVPDPAPKWDEAVDWYLDQVKAEHPEFVLVAGDLVNGHWWDGPRQIEHLANVYYGGWVRRMGRHDLKFYTAIGDHELGDDDWPSEKIKLVPYFEQAYDRHMKMPRNGPANRKGLAYYVRHRDLLLVTVETFEVRDGKMHMSVTGEQLEWVEKVLEEHADATFTIIQGHVPIIPGVRSRSSSRLMLEGGAESELWQLMKRKGVDLYFCGEHHAITAKEADGIWQIVHGASWGRVDTVNYLVAHVGPKRMDLTLKRVPLELGGGNIWNIHKNRGPREIVKISEEARQRGPQVVGTLTIDKSSGTKQYKKRTGEFR